MKTPSSGLSGRSASAGVLRRAGNAPVFLSRALFGTKAGFVVDAHGENHLTNNAGVTATTGKVGSGAQFVAASFQYLNIASNTDVAISGTATAFTFCGWVWVDAASAQVVVHKTDNANGYILYYTGTAFRFRIYNTSVAVSVDTATAGIGVWHYVTAWYDPATQTNNIQLNNGTPVSIANTVGPGANAFALAFGQTILGIGALGGKLDQWLLTKRILTAQERTDFHNAGAGLAYSALTTAHKVGMVAWWEFEPLPASLPVDVDGPLLASDTENKFSVSGGKLMASGGKVSPVYGDPAVWTKAYTRVGGLAVLVKHMRTSGNHARFGFDTNQSAGVTEGVYTDNANVYAPIGGGSVSSSVQSYTTGVEYEYILVARAGPGYLLFRRQVGTVPWTFLWASAIGADATLYGTIQNYDQVAAYDGFRVVLLSSLATDAQVYTNRLVSPAAGATTTSTADAVIEWSYTMDANIRNIHFRKVDASNRWGVRVDATSIKLHEVVAGVTTERTTTVLSEAATTPMRIVVVTEAAVIKMYVNNVLKATYSSATNFQTATSVEANTVSPGGVSELICWPRTVTLPGV